MSEQTPPTVCILVVDDEPDLQTLIRQRFRRHIRDGEFEFLFAQDGEEALSVLEIRTDVDIVLTDINMPRMDGLTLLARLAGLGLLLKSVVVSAYGDLENIRTAMNRGAFDFLTKPIDFADLEVTLQKTIQELRHLREGLLAQRQLLTVQQELDVAARIQQSILPKTFPPFPERREFDLFASMTPAQQIGGDFYDFFWIDDDRLALVIGDVSGKGVPAALYMAVTRTLLKAVAMSRPSPADCLNRVNELMVEENRSDLFVTLFYCVLHTRTGELSYCNAGHNPPHILQPAASRALENLGGIVLGVLPCTEYACGTTTLPPGSTLFMYTDGVTETMNASGEMFGEERLLSLLRAQGASAPEQLAQALQDALTAFAEDTPQHDDVTLLALHYTGGTSPQSEREQHG